MVTPKLPIYDQALKYLDLRMHSIGDLKVKLQRKGYESEEINTVIKELIEAEALNDEEYAQTYLRNLIEYKTYGYYGIYKKLVHKRLDSDLVNKLLQQELSCEKEKQIALKYLQSRTRKSDKKTLLGALQRRGFRSEVVFQILEELK